MKGRATYLQSLTHARRRRQPATEHYLPWGKPKKFPSGLNLRVYQHAGPAAACPQRMHTCVVVDIAIYASDACALFPRTTERERALVFDVQKYDIRSSIARCGGKSAIWVAVG